MGNDNKLRPNEGSGLMGSFGLGTVSTGPLSSLDVMGNRPGTYSSTDLQRAAQSLKVDKGAVYGFAAGVSGVVRDMIITPFALTQAQTWQGIGNFFTHPITSIGNGFDRMKQQWNTGNSQDRGEIAGAVAANLFLFGTAAKELLGRPSISGLMEGRGLANTAEAEASAARTAEMLRSVHEPTPTTALGFAERSLQNSTAAIPLEPQIVPSVDAGLANNVLQDVRSVPSVRTPEVRVRGPLETPLREPLMPRPPAGEPITGGFSVSEGTPTANMPRAEVPTGQITGGGSFNLTVGEPTGIDGGLPVRPPDTGLPVGPGDTGLPVRPAETGLQVRPGETGLQVHPGDPVTVDRPTAIRPGSTVETPTTRLASDGQRYVEQTYNNLTRSLDRTRPQFTAFDRNMEAVNKQLKALAEGKELSPAELDTLQRNMQKVLDTAHDAGMAPGDIVKLQQAFEQTGRALETDLASRLAVARPADPLAVQPDTKVTLQDQLAARDRALRLNDGTVQEAPTLVNDSGWQRAQPELDQQLRDVGASADRASPNITKFDRDLQTVNDQLDSLRRPDAQPTVADAQTFDRNAGKLIQSARDAGVPEAKIADLQKALDDSSTALRANAVPRETFISSDPAAIMRLEVRSDGSIGIRPDPTADLQPRPLTNDPTWQATSSRLDTQMQEARVAADPNAPGYKQFTSNLQDISRQLADPAPDQPGVLQSKMDDLVQQARAAGVPEAKVLDLQKAVDESYKVMQTNLALREDFAARTDAITSGAEPPAVRPLAQDNAWLTSQRDLNTRLSDTVGTADRGTPAFERLDTNVQTLQEQLRTFEQKPPTVQDIQDLHTNFERVVQSAREAGVPETKILDLQKSFGQTDTALTVNVAVREQGELFAARKTIAEGGPVRVEPQVQAPVDAANVRPLRQDPTWQTTQSDLSSQLQEVRSSANPRSWSLDQLNEDMRAVQQQLDRLNTATDAPTVQDVQTLQRNFDNLVQSAREAGVPEAQIADLQKSLDKTSTVIRDNVAANDLAQFDRTAPIGESPLRTPADTQALAESRITQTDMWRTDTATAQTNIQQMRDMLSQRPPAEGTPAFETTRAITQKLDQVSENLDRFAASPAENAASMRQSVLDLEKTVRETPTDQIQPGMRMALEQKVVELKQGIGAMTTEDAAMQAAFARQDALARVQAIADRTGVPAEFTQRLETAARDLASAQSETEFARAFREYDRSTADVYRWVEKTSPQDFEQVQSALSNVAEKSEKAFISNADQNVGRLRLESNEVITIDQTAPLVKDNAAMVDTYEQQMRRTTSTSGGDPAVASPEPVRGGSEPIGSEGQVIRTGNEPVTTGSEPVRTPGEPVPTTGEPVRLEEYRTTAGGDPVTLDERLAASERPGVQAEGTATNPRITDPAATDRALADSVASDPAAANPATTDRIVADRGARQSGTTIEGSTTRVEPAPTQVTPTAAQVEGNIPRPPVVDTPTDVPAGATLNGDLTAQLANHTRSTATMLERAEGMSRATTTSELSDAAAAFRPAAADYNASTLQVLPPDTNAAPRLIDVKGTIQAAREDLAVARLREAVSANDALPPELQSAGRRMIYADDAYPKAVKLFNQRVEAYVKSVTESGGTVDPALEARVQTLLDNAQQLRDARAMASIGDGPLSGIREWLWEHQRLINIVRKAGAGYIIGSQLVNGLADTGNVYYARVSSGQGDGSVSRASDTITTPPQVPANDPAAAAAVSGQTVQPAAAASNQVLPNINSEAYAGRGITTLSAALVSGMSPADYRMYNMLMHGGRTDDRPIYAVYSPPTSVAGNVSQTSFNRQMALYRADWSQTLERPTNRPFSWRTTQLAASDLARRDGVLMSNPYFTGDSRRLSRAGSISQYDPRSYLRGRYPFLMAAADQIKARHVPASVSPGAENSEALNPDQAGGVDPATVLSQHNNDPSVAMHAATQQDPNATQKNEPDENLTLTSV